MTWQRKIFHFKNMSENTCTSILPTTVSTLTTSLYINKLYHYFYKIRVVQSSTQ